jgi:hypothetical protein
MESSLFYQLFKQKIEFGAFALTQRLALFHV